MSRNGFEDIPLVTEVHKKAAHDFFQAMCGLIHYISIYILFLQDPYRFLITGPFMIQDHSLIGLQIQCHNTACDQIFFRTR